MTARTCMIFRRCWRRSWAYHWNGPPMRGFTLANLLRLALLWLALLGLAGLARAQESPQFVDVSQAAGITATHRAVWDPDNAREGYLAIGQAWGDYDRDGWLDLFVTGNLAPNRLYRNQGDGSFALSAHSPPLSLPDAPSGGATFADYDNDGWLDLYIVNHGANHLFRNQAGAGFIDVTARAGVGDRGKGSSAAWGDYDNDGWLDLYVANWSCFPECEVVDFTRQADRLYHNNGDGSFSDVSATLGYMQTLGAGFAPAFVDYDNDGDLDLYVVNDKLQNEIGNLLWRNDGAGCAHWCWANVSAGSGANLLINGMGLDAADYDNDGDFDLYITDMVYTMYLLRNDGAGFRNRAHSAGVALNYGPDQAVGWGAAFFDYDNDGWQDLYVAATNYHQTFPELEVSFMNARPDALFRNDGAGGFVDVSADSGIAVDLPTLGVAYADYDNDGDLDLVTGHWDSGYRLYQNQGADGRWLSLELRGGGAINADAVGSKVYVRAGGVTQLQTARIGSGLGGNNQLPLHFGLGAATSADIRIVWANGSECTIENVPANQRLRIVYGVTVGCGT
ncbi:MAG: CRTAC1 family protein [Chloroflexi bacterium]|nr:CRTAC1 family protein [Chloroflexota bacterium]MYA93073.1 CRTAC1 family protein [Chloroflexota bacterium]MYC55761.1 CRTAC1 family protein [Chloroflexota bacterium]MYD38787.1 CRTAC1 family protein [Chloroflexota bacterium]